MGKIGFVVWGIRKGFKNNWLSANINSQLFENLTDDMRQICNSTIDKFFSIEKINDYTILSIYNPNTKDHVQRKAYIALSLVVPNGYLVHGDVIDCLKSMMQTYEIKQGNAMVNMVNMDDMNTPISRLQLVQNPNDISHTRTKLGLFHYNELAEIQSFFKDPSIYEFKKVFFVNSQNVSLEKMSSIQHIQSFTKPLFMTISNFNQKAFIVTINNKPINSEKCSIKQGDIIQFVEIKTKRAKQLQVGTSDVWVSLLEIFPPIINSTRDPRGKNKSKLIALGVLFFGILAIGVYFFMPDSEGTIDGNGFVSAHEQATETIAAIYDFDTLKLSNLPPVDSSTSFDIFQLSNDSIAIGSVISKNPVFAFTKLRATVDTLITVKYNIKDSLISITIPVEFKIPEVYKIKPREGLSKIAERFNIKKDSLMHWNNLTDENKIKEGQELKLAPEIGTSAQQLEKENETSNNNSIKVEGTPITEKPKPTEQPAPAAGNSQKDNTTDLTQLKKDADKLIKDLEDKGADRKAITSFKEQKNGCLDQVCFKLLIENMKKEINRL